MSPNRSLYTPLKVFLKVQCWGCCRFCSCRGQIALKDAMFHLKETFKLQKRIEVTDQTCLQRQACDRDTVCGSGTHLTTFHTLQPTCYLQQFSESSFNSSVTWMTNPEVKQRRQFSLSHWSQSSPWRSFSPLQSTDTHTLSQQSYNHAVPTLTRLHLQRTTNSAPSAFLCLCNHVIGIVPPFSKLSKIKRCVCVWLIFSVYSLWWCLAALMCAEVQEQRWH